MASISGDRTTAVIGQMLDALPHPTYDVGIYNLEADKMYLRRSWDRAAIERSIGYLKQQNREGRHIYVRPAGVHPYTFMDDLNTAKVAALKGAGLVPAVVLESSPGNLQVWLKHPQTLPTALSTGVAQQLAKDFGGDPSSADWRHFGRLAGFTNRKEKYQMPNGHFPFVRLIEASGVVSPTTALIAGVANKQSQEATLEQQRRASYAQQPRSLNRMHKSIADFRNSSMYAGDNHRADLAYATYALSHGAPAESIAEAIRSRDLSHKGNAARQADYISRTLDKAQQSIQHGRSRS
jgi:hypothetical protein